MAVRKPISGGLLFYPIVDLTAIGLRAAIVFVLGLWTLRHEPRARRLLWADTIVPFALILSVQNKNLRYALPLIPAAAVVAAGGLRALAPSWRWLLTGACVVLGVLQVSMTTFAVLRPPRIPPFPMEMAIP